MRGIKTNKLLLVHQLIIILHMIKERQKVHTTSICEALAKFESLHTRFAIQTPFHACKSAALPACFIVAVFLCHQGRV